MTTERYNEILAVAARIFREKGYHATTVRDIADAARLVKGSLYHHIQSKQKLLEDILLLGMELVMPSMEEIVQMDVSAIVKAEAAVVCHVNSFARNDDAWAVFLRETTNLPPEIKPRVLSTIERYRRGWHSILEQGRQEGIFAPDLPDTLVLNGIFGMCNWIYRWYVPGGGHTISEIARVFARMSLYGIASRSAAEGWDRIVSEGAGRQPR